MKPLPAETAALLDQVRAEEVPARGVMFSPVMVRALLSGAKSQTSRARAWKVKPGDLLYVREAFDLLGQAEDRPIYKADDKGNTIKSYKPAMFMPRWATRLLLRVTGAPYQKALAEFGLEDVAREGCPVPASDRDGPLSFDELWERLNGERASTSSAIVWVHRFEVLT